MPNQPPYNPTPEQIETACAEIREKWSDVTYNTRARADWKCRAPELKAVPSFRRVREATDH